MSFNLAVILRETAHATPDQAAAAYKCPRVFQFRSELPKNALGKVLKDELAAARPDRP
jgi:acyl-coenzyme A synthetase/AMP-(fatty) acid ligase